MVEIVKRKCTVNWPANEADMSELWEDFFRRSQKKMQAAQSTLLHSSIDIAKILRINEIEKL